MLVDEFVACRNEKAALDAREIRTLAAAAALVDEQRTRLTSRDSRKTDLPVRTMVAELAAAAHVSERTVQRQLNDAADLCTRFAPVVDALAQGRISRSHALVIHDAGWPIDDPDARAQFVTTAIARAETMTAGRLRPIAETLAARLNPRTIKERHADAAATRDVQVTDLTDGMSQLLATGPAVLDPRHLRPPHPRRARRHRRPPHRHRHRHDTGDASTRRPHRWRRERRASA